MGGAGRRKGSSMEDSRSDMAVTASVRHVRGMVPSSTATHTSSTVWHAKSWRHESSSCIVRGGRQRASSSRAKHGSRPMSTAVEDDDDDDVALAPPAALPATPPLPGHSTV